MTGGPERRDESVTFSLKELMKLPEWKVVQHRPSTFRFPEGESFAEMQLRICNAVERLVAAGFTSRLV